MKYRIIHTGFTDKKTIVLIILFIIVVICLWAGILGLRHVKQQRCFYNMASLVSCLHVYMNDYENKYPTPHQWCDLLTNEAKAPDSDFRCPSAKGGQSTYAMNENIAAYEYGTVPEDLVFIFEAKRGWNQVGGKELLTAEYHEGRGCHIMYANLTVQFVKKEDFESLRWK